MKYGLENPRDYYYLWEEEQLKIIAYYLPQFHSIPENDEMWGKDFTEWTNVKKAKPLFAGHQQPVEPLNNNYYNLLNADVIKWQVDLAKEYGIYGFCFYHYWYNGHLLLEKPIELFLADKSIDFSFCICWANHDWTSSWADKEFRVIYKQDYSDRQDWDEHFYYLLPYIKDERSIKINGNPLIVLYDAAGIPQLNAMLDRWQMLAQENGFQRLEFAYQSIDGDLILGFDNSRFTYDIEYQPQYVENIVYKKNTIINRTVSYYAKKVLDFLHIDYKKYRRNSKTEESVTVVDYDDVWEKTISMKPVTSKSIPGAFVKMDTTPRIQNRGFVTQGMTPDKFYKHLKEQIINCRENYKQDMIFMFAWNEWAEGGYLEPDKQWGYSILDAVKKALEDTGEFPF